MMASPPRPVTPSSSNTSVPFKHLSSNTKKKKAIRRGELERQPALPSPSPRVDSDRDHGGSGPPARSAAAGLGPEGQARNKKTA